MNVQQFQVCLLCIGTEWVDPEDPTVIAETELLGAAASIEAAAKKLEQLKPRAKPKVTGYCSLLTLNITTSCESVQLHLEIRRWQSKPDLYNDLN